MPWVIMIMGSEMVIIFLRKSRDRVEDVLNQLHGLFQISFIGIVEGADFLAVDIQYGSHITLLVYEGNNNLGTGEG